MDKMKRRFAIEKLIKISFYLGDSMNKNTKKIVIVAMLVAFDVIFSRLLAFNVLIAKVGLGFAATAVCAMLYGPVWAGVCAALADLVGALLFPTGAYFPGFTATAAMTGVIYGLFLYKSRPNLKRCFLASLTNSLAVTLVINSLMIHFVFGPELVPLIATRSAETLIMLALQTVVMTAIASSDTLYNKIIAFGR